MNLDVLYVNWNRSAFTTFSFEMLIENTDWRKVRHLVIHDDDSTDGGPVFFKQWEQRLKDRGIQTVLDFGKHLGSAPAVMSNYVSSSDAEWFAKIDNDIVVPPGWLDAMLQVLDGDPEVDCLGMEAGRGNPRKPEWDGLYRFQDGTHMGGVGLIRVSALQRLPQFAGQDGWTKLQHEYGRVRGNGWLNIGWVSPDLAVVQLDKVPFEPWMSLTDYYVEEELGRPWGKYHPQADYWDWWPPEARGA